MAYEQRPASGNPLLDAFTTALASFTVREGYEDQRSDVARGQINQYDKQINDRLTGMLSVMQQERNQADAKKLYDDEVGRRTDNFNKVIAAVTTAKTSGSKPSSGQGGSGQGGSGQQQQFQQAVAGNGMTQEQADFYNMFQSATPEGKRAIDTGIKGVQWLDELLRSDLPDLRGGIGSVIPVLGRLPKKEYKALYNTPSYPVYQEDFDPNQKMNLGGY